MEFEEPKTDIFTVYSKSGCPNCTSVKKLLKDHSFLFHEINCDDYLIEDKEGFLSFIQNKIGREYKMFPMVFYKGDFIGGHKETIHLVDTLVVMFE